jgi:cytochrome c oxidase subunit III
MSTSSADEMIPYTVAERPDTGLYNAKFGIWLFLASEVMLFGSLISSYIILRTGAASWPVGSSILNVPMATVNTMVLIASSISVVFAWAALKENNLNKFRLCMLLTILAGVAFLAVKGVEYSTKFGHHMYPSSSTFLGIYFTLTGIHALHLIGGVIVNTYMVLTSGIKFKEDPVRFTNRIEVAGLYWHFVDLVWIFLFPLLYLS